MCGEARDENTRLCGVLALAVCAVLCGARSQYAVSQWGQDCGPEIRAALGLKRERGPSGPTVHRVFRQLDHAAFEQVLGQWFAAQGLQADEAIAIDGKTLRGIHGEEVPGVHLVAAFAHQTRTVLAQAATEGKGHELAGVKAVLAALPARRLEWARGNRGCPLGEAENSVARSKLMGGLLLRPEGEPAADAGSGSRELCRPMDPARAGGGRRSAWGPGRAPKPGGLKRGSSLSRRTGGRYRGGKDWGLAGVGPGLSLAPRSRVCQRASSGRADERMGLCAHQPDACAGRPRQTAPHLAGTVAD